MSDSEYEPEPETYDIRDSYDEDTAFADFEDHRIIKTHKHSDECKSKYSDFGRCKAYIAQDRIEQRECYQKILNAHEHSAWCNVSGCCAADLIWDEREEQLKWFLENGTYKEKTGPRRKTKKPSKNKS